MPYATTDIIQWAKIAQPLAAIGEVQKQANIGGKIDKDLHIKLYVERKSLEWQHAQNPNDTEILYGQGNYVLALMGIYLFAAQQASGGGGIIVNPVTPGLPQEIEFEVSSTSYIPTGGTSKVITQFIGYNLIFNRGQVPQSTLSQGGEYTYYSWDRESGLFTLLGPAPYNGAAQEGEIFQLIPVG